jgi:hypothetical protein
VAQVRAIDLPAYAPWVHSAIRSPPRLVTAVAAILQAGLVMNRPTPSFSWPVWFVAGGLAGLGLVRLSATESETRRRERVERLLRERLRAVLQSRDEWVNRAADLYRDTVLLGDEGVAGMVGRLRS